MRIQFAIATILSLALSQQQSRGAVTRVAAEAGSGIGTFNFAISRDPTARRASPRPLAPRDPMSTSERSSAASVTASRSSLAPTHRRCPWSNPGACISGRTTTHSQTTAASSESLYRW